MKNHKENQQHHDVIKSNYQPKSNILTRKHATVAAIPAMNAPTL